VVPEEADGSWRTLTGPDELVEFYDPTDVFGDLADALADAYPSVAPEFAGVAAASDIDDEEAKPAAETDSAEVGEEAGDSEVSEESGEAADDDAAGDQAAGDAAADDEGTEGRPTA
jgi:hypothetical protein